MILDGPLPRRLGRLIDALGAEVLGATDDDVVATHTPVEARVAAARLRTALERAAAGMAPPPDTPAPERSPASRKARADEGPR